MSTPDVVREQRVNRLKCELNRLGAPLIGNERRRWLVAFMRLVQAQLGRHESHRRLIETIVGQNVELDLVHDVQRNETVRGRDTLVGLFE